MVKVIKSHFKQFCFDLINSETKLDTVIQEENEKGIRAIYCEIPILNKLKKDFPERKDLYKYIAQHQKDKCFHICEYQKGNKLLFIDGIKYDDIVLY